MKKRIPKGIVAAILPQLYLGNQEATLYAEELQVDFIISIGCQTKSTNIESIHVGIRDKKDVEIGRELDLVCGLIDERLNQGKRVLVHCKAGVNRSPSFALAYICKFYNMTIGEGMEFIQQRRSCCKFGQHQQVSVWLEHQS